MKSMILLTSLFLYLGRTTCAQVKMEPITSYSSKPLLKGSYKTAAPGGALRDSSVQQKEYAYYMAKSSNRNTAAWVMLGGGVLCTVIGIASFPSDYNIIFGNDSKTEQEATVATVLSVVGIAAMIGSIPLFVSSSINKHKARLGLQQQRTSVGIPVAASRKMSGLTLSIELGR